MNFYLKHKTAVLPSPQLAITIRFHNPVTARAKLLSSFTFLHTKPSPGTAIFHLSATFLHQWVRLCAAVRLRPAGPRIGHSWADCCWCSDPAEDLCKSLPSIKLAVQQTAPGQKTQYLFGSFTESGLSRQASCKLQQTTLG